VAAKRETAGIEVPVVAKLDQKSLTDVFKEIAKIKRGFKDVTKESNINLKNIQGITTAASQFSKALSDNAKAAFKELGGLGDQLRDAHAEAEALEESFKSAKGAKAKAAASAAQSAQLKKIQDLNKQIDDQRKTSKEYGAQLSKIVQKQKNYQKTLESAAKYKPADMFKGVAGGVGKMLTGGKAGFKAGLADIAKSLGKGAAGKAGRAGLAGDAGAGKMAGMAKTMGMLAMAASSVATLVKLFMKATAHMSTLNKAMLEGSTLAGDSAMSANKYAQTMKDLRDAAIGSTRQMLKFGINSEQALKTVAAFSRESSGSIGQTAARLKELGEGNLDAGLLEFSKMASVYGKALGMEASDIGTMMGTFISEVGYGADTAQQALSGIVKDAAAANMPVYKFMDIFRQTIPSLDMYTNRMEELTGVIKMLSKTMSAKDVKKFMEAFGAGFEQVDFKQRLKTALVAGVGKVGSILKRDFSNAAKGVQAQFAKSKTFPNLGTEFANALKSRDPVKAMRGVVAKAMASGDVSEAAIGAAQKVARGQRLVQRGGALNIAGAMRGAGLMARMEILEAAAGALTGGNIEGLGEHVAKKITGMSEKQYAGILQLQDNMGSWMAQLSDIGMTSSKQMNDNLKEIVLGDREASSAELQERMKEMAKTESGRKKAERLIKEAATMQIESDEAIGDPIENLAAEQVEATLSLGDKIENVIGFLLEKIYWVMSEVFGFISGALWGWITGSDEAKKTNKILADSLEGFRSVWGKDPAKMKYLQDQTKKLQDLANSGVDTQTILNQMGSHITDLQGANSTDMAYVASSLGEKSDRFIELMNKGSKRDEKEALELHNMLADMDNDKLIQMLGKIARVEAGDVEGEAEQMRGTKAKSIRKSAKRSELAKAKTDLDPEAAAAYAALDRKEEPFMGRLRRMRRRRLKDKPTQSMRRRR
jgi:uncharacterized coiled-coil protein SlyX